MERVVPHNRKGVTLVEMMFALLLLSIVSLALIQMTLMAMAENIKNDLRYEAVSVSEQRMNELRSLASFTYSDLLATAATGTQEPGIVRTIRNFDVTYTPTRTVTDINSGSKQVSVLVSWTYRGIIYNHGVSSIFTVKQ